MAITLTQPIIMPETSFNLVGVASLTINWFDFNKEPMATYSMKPLCRRSTNICHVFFALFSEEVRMQAQHVGSEGEQMNQATEPSPEYPQSFRLNGGPFDGQVFVTYSELQWVEWPTAEQSKIASYRLINNQYHYKGICEVK